MAVNLDSPSELSAVSGIRLATAAAGICYQDRDDLVLIEVLPGSQVAAVFTQNAFCAAPVQVAKQHLVTAVPCYLLINSGNANAGTGQSGLRAARVCCEAAAKHFGCHSTEVLPFSTGVIGVTLPTAKIENMIPALARRLDEQGWLAAAQAIMTTDTVAKGVSKSVDIAGRRVTLSGVTKGAGMIHPDMATMLAFVATDIKIDLPLLQEILKDVVSQSFNRITVDGDTSTNDACVLIATGKSGVQIDRTSKDYQKFCQALEVVMVDLAQSIVRDGEGATKFITLHVKGAEHINIARKVAFTVAHSPLVKTAFFASDPNWGRILAAVGRAGVPDLDTHGVDISLNALQVVKQGEPAPDYTEAAGQREMHKKEIIIDINLNRGKEHTLVWTTDLSHEYVRINAEYRT